MPPGNLHAYLSGGGIEIMANSRQRDAGRPNAEVCQRRGAPRDRGFHPGFRGLITPIEESPGVWRYPTPAPEFGLWRIEAGGEAVPVPASTTGASCW